MKWVEIAKQNQNARNEALSQFANENGFNNSVSFVQVTEENWAEQIRQSMLNYDVVRVGSGLTERVLELFNPKELDITNIGAADTLMKQAGKWWPRSSGFPGLIRLLAEEGKYFQLNSEVIVVGCGGLAKVVVAAFFKEGFKKFTLVASDAGRAERLLAHLRRRYLGGEFKYVLREGLIQLPSAYGICVNTLPANTENDFIQEISYFNFLKPKGHFLDFTMDGAESPLIKEAEAIGAHAVAGYRLFAHMDGYWLSMLANKEFDINSLVNAYKQKFQPKV